jgi:hypothetical protein
MLYHVNDVGSRHGTAAVDVAISHTRLRRWSSLENEIHHCNDIFCRNETILVDITRQHDGTARIPSAIGAHVASCQAQTPIAVKQAVDTHGVTRINAGRIERASTGYSHQTKVAISRISEQRIGVYVPLT